MRKVSIKQLYRSLSKELGDLPFVVTRGGIIVALVELPGKGLDIKPTGLDNNQENCINQPKVTPEGLDKQEKGLDIDSGTDKPKNPIKTKRDAKKKIIELVPGWTGGYSKEQQTRKKAKK